MALSIKPYRFISKQVGVFCLSQSPREFIEKEEQKRRSEYCLSSKTFTQCRNSLNFLSHFLDKNFLRFYQRCHQRDEFTEYFLGNRELLVFPHCDLLQALPHHCLTLVYKRNYKRQYKK